MLAANRGIVRVIALALAVLFFGAVAGRAQAAGGGGYLRFRQAAITDDADGGKVAVRLLVPADWQVRAAVAWRNDPIYPAYVSGSVFNPGGLEAYVTYPFLRFVDGMRESAAQIGAIAGPDAAAYMARSYPEGSFYLGAEVRRRVERPMDYLKQFVIPRFRPDLASATLISDDEQPGLERSVAQINGNPQGFVCRVSKIRVQYLIGGQAVDEDFYITLTFMPIANTLSWTGTVKSFRAGKGRLDATMPLLRTVDSSSQMDIKWYNDVEQVKQMMAQVISNEQLQIAIRSRIVARTSAEISDIIRQGYEDRQRVQDKINQEWDDTIRGVDRYQSPYAEYPIEVPAGYSHAFVNALGEVIVTNEEGFNPGQVVNGDWREMKRAK